MTSRTSILLAGTAGFVFIIATQQAMAVSDTMEVTASVVSDCSLTANNLSFGAYVANGPALDATTVITYNCAPGLDIDIEISDSEFPNGGGTRQMFNAGNGNNLKYDLYQNSNRDIKWQTGADAHNVPNTSAGDQDVTVYGRIFDNTVNSSAVPDEYSDTLTVTLTING